jgi:S-adenosylmethionine hydrolase
MLRFLPALLVVCVGCAATPPASTPPVVVMTDFGLKDDAVGLMRGVILSIAPRSQIVDLTHEVPAFDVAEGARLLADAPGVYPPGSVFCVVVDPGVGTERRAIVARLKDGSMVVAPDNGVISEVVARHGPAVVRVVEGPALVRSEMSATFHGRDVFAPVSAHLAAGVPFETVGAKVDDWIRLEPQAPTREGGVFTGVVEAIDRPFGNVWTSFPADWLEDLEPRTKVKVTLGESDSMQVPWVKTFGDVPEGQPLLYVNSRGKLALALNMGDFATTHAVSRGTKVRLQR